MQDKQSPVELDPYETMMSEKTAIDADSAELDRANVDASAAETLRALGFEERYERDRAIGEGGMGSVVLYRDRQVGRRVAMKTMHPEQGHRARARRRFVTEARVQGQLEHPSVVPVYDLGIDPAGTIYFTMKRIRGVTLESIVKSLRESPAEGEKRWSRRRLLTAFSQVCLAVDFAHERGVFHRDIKPANIMLGDFGEVYVLDWGVAKVSGAADDAEGTKTEVNVADARSPEAATVPGTLLGTPGYMPPEQLRGEHERVGPASDVYALGAVLFEALTYQELHDRRSFADVVSSTLRGAVARPSVRSPDREVAPELEAIVVRATALDPAERWQSARDMHDAIERYLDGERDELRRRELSTEHAGAAAAFADRARASTGPSALEERRQAMREVGRALALDPENELALRTMIDLLSQLPDHTPPEIERDIEASQYAQTRWLGRIGGAAYVAVLPLYLPFFMWAGIRSWTGVGLFYLFMILAGGLSLTAGFTKQPHVLLVLGVMVFSNAAFATTAAFFGPWLVTPSLVAINTAAFALHLGSGYRVGAIVVGCLAVVVPVLLDLGGLLAASHVFTDAGMLITPGVISFPRTAMVVLLTAIALGAVVTGGITVTRVRDALNATERRLYLYTWHMRELLPASGGAAPGGPRP
jgi:serine/threonine-protein kinase